MKPETSESCPNCGGQMEKKESHIPVICNELVHLVRGGLNLVKRPVFKKCISYQCMVCKRKFPKLSI